MPLPEPSLTIQYLPASNAVQGESVKAESVKVHSNSKFLLPWRASTITSLPFTELLFTVTATLSPSCVEAGTCPNAGAGKTLKSNASRNPLICEHSTLTLHRIPDCCCKQAFSLIDPQ